MKSSLMFYLLCCSFMASCQVHWNGASDWRLYEYQGHGIFTISIDSLKKYGSLSMNQDSMNTFTRSAKLLDTKRPLVWMGGFVATCKIDGTARKVELSRYGGFFFDEKTKTYYQIPTEKIDEWLAFIQTSYESLVYPKH